jgi:hypothetical protein
MLQIGRLLNFILKIMNSLKVDIVVNLITYYLPYMNTIIKKSVLLLYNAQFSHIWIIAFAAKMY